MLDFSEKRYTANWFVDPKLGMKLLGVKAKLRQEDWLVLKQFPFGEFAFDYEEGLKFSGNFKQIPELKQFIEKVHADNNLSLKAISGKGKSAHEFDVFQVGCCSSETVPAFKRACKKAGLVAKEDSSWPSFVLASGNIVLEAETTEKPKRKSSKLKLEKVLEIPLAGLKTRQERVASFFNKIEKTMITLFCRWQDEQEYEDINDYAKPLEKPLKELGGTMVGMVKRPFGFKFEIEGAMYQITINARKYGYQLISTPKETFDSWVNKCKGKEESVKPKVESTAPTQEQLSAAFDLVKDKSNWKMPINAKVPATENIDLIESAIVHFTSSIPSISIVSGGKFFRIKAAGYYKTVGS
jgi:hypothetical protein